MSCVTTSLSHRSAPRPRSAMLPEAKAGTSWSGRSRRMSSTGRTIRELAGELRAGTTSPRQLLAEAIAHQQRVEPQLHAYLAQTHELAERQADAAARTLEQRPQSASPLCGIPMALKDVLCVQGVETTAASRILRGFR